MMIRFICFFLCLLVMSASHAQEPITEMIKAGVVKVIKAVDLKIQRLQNETIRMQHAQKIVENTLSKLKLEEIAGWVERQKQLYEDYYDELWKVKNYIAFYHRIRDITAKQLKLVAAYQQAMQMIHRDTHFSPDELDHMKKVYAAILQRSVDCVDQLPVVINAFATRMTDQERLDLIDQFADALDEVYTDLLQFNQQNLLLSLQRAKDERDVEHVKVLYGIE